MKKAYDSPAVRAAERLNSAVEDFRRHLRSDWIIGALAVLTLALLVGHIATGG
jgi:hypothetical protein